MFRNMFCKSEPIFDDIVGEPRVDRLKEELTSILTRASIGALSDGHLSDLVCRYITGIFPHDSSERNLMFEFSRRFGDYSMRPKKKPKVEKT